MIRSKFERRWLPISYNGLINQTYRLFTGFEFVELVVFFELYVSQEVRVAIIHRFIETDPHQCLVSFFGSNVITIQLKYLQKGEEKKRSEKKIH